MSTITRIRKLLSMSTRDLADMLDVSERHLRRIESGKISKSESVTAATMVFFAVSHERAVEVLFTDTLPTHVVARLAKVAFGKRVVKWAKWVGMKTCLENLKTEPSTQRRPDSSKTPACKPSQFLERQSRPLR